MQSLADEKRKAWKESKKNKQKGQDAGDNADKDGGRGGGCSGHDRPPRGHDNVNNRNDDDQDPDEEEEENEGEYQKARGVVCIHEGASSLSSHREFKQLSRKVNVIQPSVEATQPLKLAAIRITFDIEDHPDRTSGVGILPVVVSPLY